MAIDYLDAFAQAMILLTGITSIFLVAKKNKWGWIVGLVSQPFWFITAYLHNQWGVFLNTLLYSAAWCYGAYAWFKEDEKQKGKGKKRGKEKARRG